MNTSARRRTNRSSLLLLTGMMIVLAILVLTFPLVVWCTGILLLVALIGALATLRSKNTSEAGPSALGFKIRRVFLATMLFWVCGLTLTGGALGMLPVALFNGLRQLKRRLVLALFRREAALPSVTITSLAELHRLRPGRRFTLTVRISKVTPPAFQTLAGAIALILERDARAVWRIQPAIKSQHMTLELPDGELTALLRTTEIVLPASDSNSENAAATRQNILITPGDQAHAGGQVALSDAKNPYEPRYHLIRLELLQSPRGLTSADIAALSPRSFSIQRFDSPASSSDLFSVPRLPPPVVSPPPGQRALRDADIDGDAE